MYGEWLSIGGAVLGVVGILGGASAYFSSSRAQTIIALQKEELEVTKDSNERLKRERDDLLTRMAGLEGQVKTLTDLLTQRPQIEQLAAETLKQHGEVIRELKGIAKVLATPTTLSDSTVASLGGNT